MNTLLDSFWRALVYCMHPRIIVMSLVPLMLLALIVMGLAYFFGQSALDAVRYGLDSSVGLGVVWHWLDSMGFGGIKRVLVPVIVVLVTTPLVVIVSLLLISIMLGSFVVNFVGGRRYPTLERKQGGAWWRSVIASGGATLLALLALVVSLPFWVFPPIALTVPPLIWGWLTYRVLTYDALASHASTQERLRLIAKNRGTLLLMGLVCGYLGALPSLIWVSGALFVVFFLFLIPIVIGLYTWVFVFSSMWFTHYCLAELEVLRAHDVMSATVSEAPDRGVDSGPFAGNDLPPSF